MKALILLLVFVTLAATEASAWTAEEQQIFQEWKEEFRKVYRSEAEESEAMENVLKNKQKIDAHNKLFELGKVSYEQGLFEYSDLSPIQLKMFFHGIKFPKVLRPPRARRSVEDQSLDFRRFNRQKAKDPNNDVEEKPQETSFLTRMILIFVELIGSLLKGSN